MRSTLVFLPPPHLSLFAVPPSSAHHVRLHLAPSACVSAGKGEAAEVADSVDVHGAPLGGEPESIVLSSVPDAPTQVPWERLHGPELAPLSPQLGGARVRKRVRIRSPVLAIETRDRTSHPASRKRAPPLDTQRVQGSIQADTDCDQDTSRIVLGQDSDDDEDQARSRPLAALTQAPTKDNRSLEYVESYYDFVETEADTSRVDLGRVSDSDEQDEHTTAGWVTDTLELLPALGLLVTEDHASASMHEAKSASTSISASSLPIRPPIPAPTCRFTFFSKPRREPRRACTTSTSTTPPIVLVQAPPESTHSGQSVESANPHSRTSASAVEVEVEDASAGILAQEPSYSIRPMPTMNATSASYTSLEVSQADLLTCAHEKAECNSIDAGDGHSILPPPTLHFSLAAVTPLSHILADPIRFISPTSIPRRETPGAISGKVNLLVVVKEIGKVVRARSKFALDLACHYADTGPGFHSPATQGGVGRDGKTERVELLVMDGSMSRTQIDTPLETYLFKLVLWGQLARHWTTPTALHTGDVISVTNLTLYPQSHPRLGPGFPTKPSLAAHASSTHTSLELCYRAHAPPTFDPALARFDLKRRRILELSALWHSTSAQTYA